MQDKYQCIYRTKNLSSVLLLQSYLLGDLLVIRILPNWNDGQARLVEAELVAQSQVNTK